MDLYEDLAWAGFVLRDALDFESAAFRGDKEGFLELGVWVDIQVVFLLWRILWIMVVFMWNIGE